MAEYPNSGPGEGSGPGSKLVLQKRGMTGRQPGAHLASVFGPWALDPTLDLE